MRPQPETKTVAPLPLTPAQRTLTMAWWMYEDGDYGGSENYLKSALSQETTDAERCERNKYLAFILCAERREQECGANSARRSRSTRILSSPPPSKAIRAGGRLPVG